MRFFKGFCFLLNIKYGSVFHSIMAYLTKAASLMNELPINQQQMIPVLLKAKLTRELAVEFGKV